MQNTASVLVKTIIFVLAGFSFESQAQDFEIKNSDFKTLYNKYRIAQPLNCSPGVSDPKKQCTPWAGQYYSYRWSGIATKNGLEVEYPASDGGIKRKETFFEEGMDQSASGTYDSILGLQGARSSTQWEMENHSCENVDKELKEGCLGWWGHCNAWAAAAIKEQEPRNVVTVDLKGRKFSLTINDQKAWLTEMWMESGSLFTGATEKGEETKNWIAQPDSAKGSKRVSYGHETLHEAFWDVSPRTFFLVFTNYVGLLNIGVVIDRFTGDQVWNQPVVGYRLLPIRPQDIEKVTEEVAGKKFSLWSVHLRSKIYWANDGVTYHHKSATFDINNHDDRVEEESFGLNQVPAGLKLPAGEMRRYHIEGEGASSYEGRAIGFTLYFEAETADGSPIPFEVSADGKQVVSAGQMVGEGIWDHQKIAEALHSEGRLDDSTSLYFNNGHPDFIWLPTQVYRGGEGNSNPYLAPKLVKALLEASRVPTASEEAETLPPKDEQSAQLSQATFVFKRSLFKSIPQNQLLEHIKRRLKNAFKREGINTIINRSDAQFDGEDVIVVVAFPKGVSQQMAFTLLKDAGLEFSTR